MSPRTMPRGPIVIEYDYHKQRKRKTFTNPYVARQFWSQKDAAGKHPRIVKPGTQS